MTTGEHRADDYLTKPFNPRELLARIKAVLRRVTSLPPQRGRPAARRLRFDRWVLDTGRRELEGEDGVAVPLSTGEYLLLVALLERPRLCSPATSCSTSRAAARRGRSTAPSTTR